MAESNALPAYVIRYLTEGISNHCPIKAEQLHTKHKARRPFKYCNIWGHLGFLEKVETAWQMQVHGCAMYQVVKKLNASKQGLKELNKLHFRDILVEVEDDKIKLEQIQRELQTSPRDQDIQGKEKAQYQKFIRYSYVVESFLQQRSKATWIRIGDDNSKYFFSVIKQKKLKEAVIQLRYGNDVIHIEPEEISKTFVEYYKELLGKKVVDRTRAARRIMINRLVLSTTQHMDMIKPYTNEDVRDAIFSIDGNKRSGPDGYESDFFKKAWTIVGKYVTTAVLQFLSNGK
ncbi:uncharacterized protein LOC107801473 [Nicotiana tabacum]|uniref:uncharacterized protein LOC107801473 n=1 Tax=Nicotiana tabacum TaxID=4097 RepID=UPI003F4F2484